MKKKRNMEKNILENLTKEQLTEIINKVSDKNESSKKEIEDYINKNKAHFEYANNHSEYSRLWDEAEEIISKFNEYGGGPEDEEEIVDDNLSGIVDLFTNNKLDKKTKIDFINGCFEQYYYGNSGFEDLLRDSIFEVCTTKEDWLFVIEKLKKSLSNYDAECIMKIYKDKLKDDKTYLKLRMAKLNFGMDYYDLVEYYHKKEDIEKAIAIAKEGIEKGAGRIIDLIEFLLRFYTENKDYKNILKYKIMSFKESPSFEDYVKIIKFSNHSDKNAALNELNMIINNSKDEELKAEINYFNGNYQQVLEYVKSYCEGFFYQEKFKKWAQKLEPIYPKDILRMYMERVKYILKFKISKEYTVAGYYLQRVKLIYLDIINDEKEWANLLDSLNRDSIKLPSFQKMLKSIGE